MRGRTTKFFIATTSIGSFWLSIRPRKHGQWLRHGPRNGKRVERLRRTMTRKTETGNERSFLCPTGSLDGEYRRGNEELSQLCARLSDSGGGKGGGGRLQRSGLLR